MIHPVPGFRVIIPFLVSASITASCFLVDAPAIGKTQVPDQNKNAPQKKLSREEELRRERMRARLGQPIAYDSSGRAVITENGDLFLKTRNGDSQQLTNTPSAEIAPQLSIAGDLVAFVRDGALLSLNLKTRSETQLSPEPADGLSYGAAEFIAQEEMDRFDGFWISPDGNQVVYQETDERHIPNYPILHQGDTQWSVENHRYPFAGKTNANVRLGVVRSTGGPTRWLELLPGQGEHYVARVHWDSPSSFLVQLLSRDQKKLHLLRVNPETGSHVTLFTESSPDWVNLHEDFHLVDSATGEFIWASEESGFKQLQLRSREGRRIRNLTTGPAVVDKVLKLIPERREVWYLAWDDSPLESHIYRVSLDGSAPVRLTSEPGMHDATINPDGSGFSDRFSSVSQPPITIAKDRDGKKIDLKTDESSKSSESSPHGASSTNPSTNQSNRLDVRLLKFQNRVGVTLYGAYYPPRNLAPGQKAPLIVIVYGGPHVQTVTNAWRMATDPQVAEYTSKGIAVWKMDNRGSSRRGHAFEAPIYRQMGMPEVDDQVDGVRFVGTTFPEVDTSRIGITGGSYGGYMTLRALTEAPETFHVGVSFAPVTDWDGYDTCYTERYMETPVINPEGYRRSSILPHVANLKGKLLLVHGMIDENVHYRHTARLVQALMEANRPFELLAVPEGRHGFRRAADAAFTRRKTVDFFLRHLNPATQSSTEKKPNESTAPAKSSD